MSTRGFSASEDASVEVCVLGPWSKAITYRETAIFRQISQHEPRTHHDVLEFPDGRIVPLTFLEEGQKATVRQLPGVTVGAKAPERAAYV